MCAPRHHEGCSVLHPIRQTGPGFHPWRGRAPRGSVPAPGRCRAPPAPSGFRPLPRLVIHLPPQDDPHPAVSRRWASGPSTPGGRGGKRNQVHRLPVVQGVPLLHHPVHGNEGCDGLPLGGAERGGLFRSSERTARLAFLARDLPPGTVPPCTPPGPAPPGRGRLLQPAALHQLPSGAPACRPRRSAPPRPRALHPGTASSLGSRMLQGKPWSWKYAGQDELGWGWATFGPVHDGDPGAHPPSSHGTGSRRP